MGHQQPGYVYHLYPLVRRYCSNFFCSLRYLAKVNNTAAMNRGVLRMHLHCCVFVLYEIRTNIYV